MHTIKHQKPQRSCPQSKESFRFLVPQHPSIATALLEEISLTTVQLPAYFWDLLAALNQETAELTIREDIECTTRSVRWKGKGDEGV
ncbi:hypothetical protein Dimus_003347, partial [Dionaea muscipula]